MVILLQNVVGTLTPLAAHINNMDLKEHTIERKKHSRPLENQRKNHLKQTSKRKSIPEKYSTVLSMQV